MMEETESQEAKKKREQLGIDTLKAIGTTLLKSDNTPFDVPPDFFKGKVVGVYFSAHWCPPCRAFTPVLNEKVASLKRDGKAIEVIFVSSDGSEGEFVEYFTHEMKSLVAIPFADSSRKTKLSSLYSVTGIPTLILIDGDTGELITNNGRQAIQADVYPFKNTPSTAGGMGGSSLRGLLFIIAVASLLRFIFKLEVQYALLVAVVLAMLLRVI